MTELEEEIMLFLMLHPGARKREIASGIKRWVMDLQFRNAMLDLEKDGVLRFETHNDPAQMEFYDKWYVVAP